METSSLAHRRGERGLNQSELEHARDLVAALVRLHFSDQEGTKWRSVPALSKTVCCNACRSIMVQHFSKRHTTNMYRIARQVATRHMITRTVKNWY